MRPAYIVVTFLFMLIGGCGGSSSDLGGQSGNQQQVVDENREDTPGDVSVDPVEQPVDVAPQLDLENPRIVSFAGAGNGAAVAGTVSFAIEAEDNVLVVFLELLANGERIAHTNTSRLEYGWHTAGVEPGQYILTARATDSSQNECLESISLTVCSYTGADIVLESEDPLAELAAPVTATPVVVQQEVDLPPLETSDSPQLDNLPALIVSGLEDGATVCGQHHISVVGVSRLGINAIAILIDGKQEGFRLGTSLDFLWDTESYADGEHSVKFLIRDNSGLVCEVPLTAIVDNLTDLSPPEFDISRSTWSAGVVTGFLENPFRNHYFGAGEVALEIEALDESELLWFRMYIDDELVAEADGNLLELDWPPAECVKTGYCQFTLAACDVSGFECRERYVYQHCRTATLMGYLRVGNDRLYGAELYLLPGAIDDPDACDPDTAIASYVEDESNGFSFQPPHGVYTLYCRDDDRHACLVLETSARCDYIDAGDFQFTAR
ncbi:hypothetical protein JW859_05715 [bacterium]|nr:hypothetical protein [bacterium]